MADTDDESESIASPSRPEERRQAELRQTYDERQAALQAELQKQTELIKEGHGADLENRVTVAGIDDAEIKALAVDQMAQSIAANGVQPSQISSEDFWRLTEKSIEEAYQLRDAQQRDPMQGVQPHDPKRDYGALQDAHEQVAGQKAAGGVEETSRAVAQGEQAAKEPQKAATDQQNAPDPLQPVEIQDHGPAETHHRVQAFLDAERQQRQADVSNGQADRPEAAHEPQPGEVQTNATTRNGDRVEEFLKAENLSREERKVLLQELGRAAGREVTEREGKEITHDQGGGQSL